MMRDTKFRGLTTKGEMIFGSLVVADAHIKHMPKQHTKTWIVTSAFGNGGWFNVRHRQYVKSETVGQFTGLQDKNGVDIYEGDVIKSYHFTSRANGKFEYINHIVKWSEKFHSWFLLNCESMDEDDGSIQFFVYLRTNKDFEVIGNIHSNP